MIEVKIAIPPELERFIGKLSGLDPVITKELKTAAGQSALAVKAGWQNVAPIETRKYVTHIYANTHTLPGGSVQAIIGTPVTSETGFPYPSALEMGPQYHYRGTRLRGQQTAGQVLAAVEKRMRQVNQFFSDAVNRIMRALKV